jgi:PKD domain
VTLTKTETGLEEPGGQQVGIDAQGDAVAAWGRFRGVAAETIETSQDRALGSAWSAPRIVSGPGKMEEFPQLAVNEAGNAMIVWERQEPDGTGIIEASSGTATAVAWQPAKAVSATAPGSEAKEADVAMDAQGNAAGVWAALQGGFYLAEAAGFDGAGPVIGGLSIPRSGSVSQVLAFSDSAADVWSPLGATTWSFGDGQSATGTSVTHAYSKAGTYTVTLTSADTLSNATSASAAVTISAVAATGPPPKPVLSGARLTHTKFRVAKRPTAISAAASGKPPLGTSFRFALSEAAAVKIVFTRTAPGLRSAGRCLGPSPKLARRHRRRCTRTVVVGSLTRAREAKGADSIDFSGRIGRRALPPRAYRATLTAVAAGRSSAPSSLSLTIVP